MTHTSPPISKHPQRQLAAIPCPHLRHANLAARPGKSDAPSAPEWSERAGDGTDTAATFPGGPPGDVCGRRVGLHVSPPGDPCTAGRLTMAAEKGARLNFRAPPTACAAGDYVCFASRRQYGEPTDESAPFHRSGFLCCDQQRCAPF